MFVAMGLSAVFPVLHGLKMYGFQQMNKQIGLLWVILQGMLYITGAATYAVGCILCTAPTLLISSARQEYRRE